MSEPLIPGETPQEPSSASPLTEPARLLRVHELALGGGEDWVDESLDRLTRLASRMLDVPVALVSVVHEDQQVFASQIGLAEPWAGRGRTPLSHSFCQHVVISGEALVVEDARDHPLVHANAAIRDLGVIAYAGAPLVVGRECVGSFCVIDGSPRSWTDEEVATLRDLAAMVATELELRSAIVTREAAHRQALRAETQYRALVEGMSEGVVVHDNDGKILASNPAAERILGLTADQVAGRTLRDPRWRAVHESGAPFEGHDHPAMVTLRTGRALRDVLMGVHRADGTRRWISIATQPLPPEVDGGHVRVISTFTDVTERRSSEIALRLDAAEQAALTRVATLVAGDGSPDDVFAAVAEEAARVLEAQAAGVVRREVSGGAVVVGVWAERDLERPAIGSAVDLDGATAVAEVLRSGRASRVTYDAPGPSVAASLPYRCGVAAPIHLAGTVWGAVTVASTRISGFDSAAVGRLQRFAQLVALAVSGAEARARLVALATTDDLTGLANQRAFRDHLDREIGRAKRRRRTLSLIMLDVDRFKQINDTYGHPEGDRVLVAVAARLEALARGDELVARIGGEEFAWILPEADADQGSLAASRAVEAVRSLRIPGLPRVTVSAGVRELRVGASAADLVEGADRALYAAKASGRDRVFTAS
jgi:diguanylate cyclase (GGDEF)-like protein/PAS domain S-box-containing protein